MNEIMLNYCIIFSSNIYYLTYNN